MVLVVLNTMEPAGYTFDLDGALHAEFVLIYFTWSSVMCQQGIRALGDSIACMMNITELHYLTNEGLHVYHNMSNVSGIKSSTEETNATQQCVVSQAWWCERKISQVTTRIINTSQILRVLTTAQRPQHPTGTMAPQPPLQYMCYFYLTTNHLYLLHGGWWCQAPPLFA